MKLLTGLLLLGLLASACAGQSLPAAPPAVSALPTAPPTAAPPVAVSPTTPPTAVPTDAPLVTPLPMPTRTTQELEAMILDTTGFVNGVHDPTIIQQGDMYYLFSTGRGILTRCSADLLEWDTCGPVFVAYPEWLTKAVPGVGDLWAPDIVFHNGKYHLYYSASTFGSNRSAIGLATNVTLDPSSPDHEWIDEGEVISSQPGDNFNTIDPNLSFDKEGKPWLAFGSFWSGLKLVPVDPATGKPAPDAELLSIASKPGNTAIEAAFITRRGDYYYLFVSHDFCCRGLDSTYNMRVGRAQEITGPYLDRDGKPLLSGGGTLVYGGSERWRGPGHNSILVRDDTYYLVYHSYNGELHGNSTLRIEELEWDADGWPLSPSALLGK